MAEIWLGMWRPVSDPNGREWVCGRPTLNFGMDGT